MDRIVITKEGLEQAKENILNAARSVEEVFNECDKEIAKVQSNYQTSTQADSAGAVVRKYNEYKEKYEVYLNKIIERASTLQITNEIVEAADKAQAQIVEDSFNIN